jgi:hypothetical protein
MDYQALGLGDAASVVTAVTVDTDVHFALLSVQSPASANAVHIVVQAV